LWNKLIFAFQIHTCRYGFSAEQDRDNVITHHRALEVELAPDATLFFAWMIQVVAVITTRKSRVSTNQFPALAKFGVPMDQAEINNWKSIAESMEAKGETQSWFYLRARAIAEGKPDPMPNISELMPESI
tara:strand:- start:846 stop:1235 length:390 start_codon:yes stop_codon:yes gene_type:complete